MSAHHRTSAWIKTSKAARARITPSLPLPCVDCGRAVTPDQKWHVGHIVAVSMGGTDDASNLGPSHVGCNTSAGGSMGARKANANRKAQTAQDKRELDW